jgi:hypothetical protein
VGHCCLLCVYERRVALTFLQLHLWLGETGSLPSTLSCLSAARTCVRTSVLLLWWAHGPSGVCWERGDSSRCA